MNEPSDLLPRGRRGDSLRPPGGVGERFLFANILIALRQAAGWNQRDLAEASGVQQSEISRIERALTIPTVVRAQRLLEPLGFRLTPTPIDDANQG